MEGKTQLCFICCYSFPLSTRPGEGEEAVCASGDKEQFKLFCEQLSLIGDGVGGKNSILRVVGSEAGGFGLSVCPDCFSLIRSAVRLRGKTEEVERRVLRLQREILEEMGRLKESMAGWCGEVGRIEETVRRSDKSCLEFNLGKERKLKRDVELFRKKISEVTRDLTSYQNQLDEKLLVSHRNPSKLPSTSEAKRKRLERQTKSKSAKAKKTQVPPPLPGPHVVDFSPFIPVHLKQEVDEGAPFPEQEEILPLDVDFDPGSDPEADPDPDQGQEDAEKDPLEDRDFVPDPEEMGSEDDAASNYSEELDDPPAKKKKSKGNISFKLWPNSSLSIDTNKIKLSSMTPFKRAIVWRALKRQAQREMAVTPNSAKDNNAEAEKELSLEDKHAPRLQHYVKYNRDLDKLFVGDVEFILDEKEKSIHCSLCPYTPNLEGSNRRGHDMERYLLKHILARHLNAFTCPLTNCQSVFRTEYRFKQHLRAHEGLIRLSCDICGKPIPSKDVLRNHKWSHLNEEERQEAIMDGATDPRLKYKHFRDRLTNSLFPCPQCGKAFRTEATLRQHEMIHLGPERETVVCPKCGKTMLQGSYDTYHKKYACPAEDQGELRRVKCLHCEMTFKNLAFMKRHVRRKHSSLVEERPMICEVCGKGFKTKDCLAMHVKIHNQEGKEWRCGKGCGRLVNTKRNLRRHEVNCKGGGSKPKSESRRGARQDLTQAEEELIEWKQQVVTVDGSHRGIIQLSESD